MSVEIECKLRVESHDPLRSALAARGARLLGRHLEINRMFDRVGHPLRTENRGLRIRERRALDDRGAVHATVTYKGPPQIGSFKSREEIEFTASDAAAAAALLDALGYHETLRFEKRRESWRWEQCEIDLDELPRLGCFVEIEGPNEAAVRDAIDTLGLSGVRQEAATYAAMVDAHLAHAQAHERVLCF